MFELVNAGGFLMWPIILCSIISMAIVAERFWSLREAKIAPQNLLANVWQWHKSGKLDSKRIQALRQNSPLGMILAAGLLNRKHSREVMKESIEEVGRLVAHSLERFLNTLGTIASITPLLGLLGTVIGMIKVFTVITPQLYNLKAKQIEQTNILKKCSELFDSGKLKIHVDNILPIENIAQAHEIIEDGHAIGKIVIVT